MEIEFNKSDLSQLEGFLTSLTFNLVENHDIDHNIIRKHTKKLITLGDVSFPLNIKSWHHLLKEKPSIELQTIFDYSKTISTSEDLINLSKLWNFPIHKSCSVNDNCHIYFDKPVAFKKIIVEVLIKASKYGSYNMNKSLTLTTDVVKDDNLFLTELRVLLLKQVAHNFLTFNNCNANGEKTIKFCSKSLVNDDVIVCGPILNSKGSKDVETTSKVYYDQRTLDMRLMAEHKYGLRITSKPGWKEFFAKLGSAAIIIEMLQNRPNNCTTIDINNHYIKNASFILYNCARLSTLLKEFEKRVSEKVYPPLIAIDEIDFNLLEQPEEWELLYVYILQFPVILKNCIKDIDTCKINVHYLVAHLGSMTSVFSGYYRRIKILIEPRDYLFKILHARIYLLKALEQVFHNGLNLLDIEPVQQM